MRLFRKLNCKCVIITFATVLITLVSCGRGYRNLEGMVWHTTFHITYESDRDLTDSIYKVLDEVGRSLNFFDDLSLVSKVNANDSTDVDADFIRVYEMSRMVNNETAGAFDPTLGPLIDAWGFGRGHEATSDTLRLDSLLQITGIDKTHLENGRLIKSDKGIRFNFSAIAKGYGCDRIGEMLERNGVTSYLVEIGGEICCKGQGPRADSDGKWRVSIDKPIITDSLIHESQCVIAVTDCGIATSGNYRNFHQGDGSRYGHTISSITGRPVQTDVLSATVIAPTAMEADAFATSMMAMGKEKSAALADRFGLATLLILSDGSIWQNSAFEKLTVSAQSEHTQ